ncbi:hypothetical protein, partial [Candidatus Protofrankia datiscae]|uniref:hypothetical protein n=1 Tax=Candidatus Protofrankia datiscae TaxID=2716812 RepID=UPI001F4A038A
MGLSTAGGAADKAPDRTDGDAGEDVGEDAAVDGASAVRTARLPRRAVRARELPGAVAVPVGVAV